MSTTTAPKPPAHLPPSVKAKWIATHAEALKQAARDLPEDPSGQRATAIRAANQHVKVADPTTHAEAQKMVDDFEAGNENAWKLIARGDRKVDGKPHLSIVTANGRKLLFAVPPAKEPKETKKSKAEQDAEAAAAAAAAEKK